MSSPSSRRSAAGVQPVATITGRRDRPEPRFFVGSSKVRGDPNSGRRRHRSRPGAGRPCLSPSQERNLEKAPGPGARSQRLILDIFAQRAPQPRGQAAGRARAAEAPASRLVRGWTHLERQKASASACAARARRSSRPTAACSASDARAETPEKLQAAARDRPPAASGGYRIPSVALVGYTARQVHAVPPMTGADAYVADQLFATLDPAGAPRPAARAAIVAGRHRRFIRELPHELVAAFQSTLRGAQGRCCCT